MVLGFPPLTKGSELCYLFLGLNRGVALLAVLLVSWKRQLTCLPFIWQPQTTCILQLLCLYPEISTICIQKGSLRIFHTKGQERPYFWIPTAEDGKIEKASSKHRREWVYWHTFSPALQTGWFVVLPARNCWLLCRKLVRVHANIADTWPWFANSLPWVSY